MTRISMLLGATALAATSCCLLFASEPVDARSVAVASPQDGEALSTAVQFDDLDLARPAGRHTLNRRVIAAVRSVCAPARDNVDHFLFERCRSQAQLQARPKIAAVIARAQQLAQRPSDRMTGAAVAIAASDR